LLRFWQASLQVHYKEVQSHRELTRNLELRGRRGSGDVPNMPEGFGWKTLGPWRGGQGSIASRLEKQLIESGMS